MRISVLLLPNVMLLKSGLRNSIELVYKGQNEEYCMTPLKFFSLFNLMNRKCLNKELQAEIRFIFTILSGNVKRSN